MDDVFPGGFELVGLGQHGVSALWLEMAGAIVPEFSSPSTDENDFFTDPRIQRMPEVAEE